MVKSHALEDIRKLLSIRELRHRFGQVAVCTVIFRKHLSDKGGDAVEIKVIKLFYRESLGFGEFKDNRFAARFEYPVDIGKAFFEVFEVAYTESDGYRSEEHTSELKSREK